MWGIQGVQRVFTSSFLMLGLIGGAAPAGGVETDRLLAAAAADADGLADGDVQQGFVSLFDGVSFDGWKGAGTCSNYDRPAFRWSGDIEDRIAQRVHRLAKETE